MNATVNELTFTQKATDALLLIQEIAEEIKANGIEVPEMKQILGAVSLLKSEAPPFEETPERTWRVPVYVFVNAHTNEEAAAKVLIALEGIDDWNDLAGFDGAEIHTVELGTFAEVTDAGTRQDL